MLKSASFYPAPVRKVYQQQFNPQHWKSYLTFGGKRKGYGPTTASLISHPLSSTQVHSQLLTVQILRFVLGLFS
jgi:hypothetical protein